MSKLINYDSEVSEKILSGVKKTAKIVGETLGPLGNNVILSDNGYTKITKDGITVLKSVEFEDQYENVAAQLLREASDKTNTQAGDGTTGTCILAESIYKNGLKHCIAGGNKIQIRNGISHGADYIVKFINSLSKKISTKEEIRQVAKISSNHSDEIADVLADVFSKIGQNGTIKVESGNGTAIESRIVEGMNFDQGYLSPYFVSNDAMECDLDNPFIFIVDKKITNIQEMLVPLQALSQIGKPILVIAENVEGDAISTMVLNKLRGLQICAVKSPSYGQNRKNMLKDIAVLTGGKVISEETGIALKDALPDSGILGTAKRVVVTKDSTTIIGGLGNEEALKMHIEQLKNQIYNCSDEYDLKKMKERLAKLDGGVGIISVGAKTESELREKKDLVDDAFCACKAAIANGVVAGGGVALLLAKDDFASFIDAHPDAFSGDEIIGAKVLCDALDAPIRKILENAGESADIIISKLIDESKNGNDNIGFDVLNKKYGDMIDLGIVDPANVIISEVQNGSSIASLLLTTSAAIVEKKEEKRVDPGAMSGGMGMPGMGMM